MTNNSIISTQMILTSNFVKYDTLRNLIPGAFPGSKATTVNLYLDLYGVEKTLFSDSFRTDISDYTGLVSTIINMCIHYRTFFKYIGVHTKIYLIFSYNTSTFNRMLVPDYNRTFVEKSGNAIIRQMVETNNILLETLCPFLRDIFFLKTEFESSVLIDHLISEYSDGNPNIVISKDIYPIQLTCLHPNTAYLRPRKAQGMDISALVPPREEPMHDDAFWGTYCVSRQSHIARKNIWIHPVNFPTFCALSKFPDRSLKNLINATTANKMIHNIVGGSPTKISVGLVDPGKTSPEVLMMAEERFKAIDIEYARGAFMDSVEPRMIHLDNLNDPEAVRSICSEYFKNNPVDITKL